MFQAAMMQAMMQSGMAGGQQQVWNCTQLETCISSRLQVLVAVVAVASRTTVSRCVT